MIVITSLSEEVRIEYAPDELERVRLYCETARLTVINEDAQLIPQVKGNKVAIVSHREMESQVMYDKPPSVVGPGDLHVDDFVDSYFGKHEYARWFFFLHRLAAVYQVDWAPYIKHYKLFCTYKSMRWRVTGASRFGDIWLTKDFNRETGYEERVSVADCVEWSSTPDYNNQKESRSE